MNPKNVKRNITSKECAIEENELHLVVQNKKSISWNEYVDNESGKKYWHI